MPVSPSPHCSFWMTERTAWPPEAQAFSTDSMGFASRPGTWATRPARRPCSLSEMLQTAPIEATSRAEAAIPISWQVPVTAFATISGTVMPMSLPKTDWW